MIASVEGNFTQWLNNVKAYDEISLTADEERSKQYEKEFFEEYKILDEDADTAAFEHEKQIFLYNLLTNLQEQLRLENKDDPKIIEIIEQSENLKNNIQNPTKRKVVREMSKIYAKIKKHGLKLLLNVWEDTKKEAFKRLISAAFDFANEQAHNLGHHLHNLGS